MRKMVQKNITLNYTVRVDQKDIKRGKMWDAEFCPIAYALKDEKFKDVYVDASGIQFRDGDFAMTYKIPKEAKKFIRDFDDEKEVKPLSFKITLSDICTEYKKNKYDYEGYSY
jgi:hypothetical protein